jgi:hypothetical protein
MQIVDLIEACPNRWSSPRFVIEKWRYNFMFYHETAIVITRFFTIKDSFTLWALWKICHY